MVVGSSASLNSLLTFWSVDIWRHGGERRRRYMKSGNPHLSLSHLTFLEWSITLYYTLYLHFRERRSGGKERGEREMLPYGVIEEDVDTIERR